MTINWTNFWSFNQPGNGKVINVRQVWPKRVNNKLDGGTAVLLFKQKTQLSTQCWTAQGIEVGTRVRTNNNVRHSSPVASSGVELKETQVTWKETPFDF